MLSILRERGVEFDHLNYFEQPFTEAQLQELLKKLDLKPADLLRKNEAIYRELQLGQGQHSDAELIRLMVEQPALIQRPIIVRGKRAVLGRPPERVAQLL